MDEAGVQYVGMVYITQIPILNTGPPLVSGRSRTPAADVAAARPRQRAVAQAPGGGGEMEGATDLVNDASGLTRRLTKEVSVIEAIRRGPRPT